MYKTHKCYTIDEAVALIEDMSEDEEDVDPHIVVLPPENVGEVTDEEQDADDDSMHEVAGYLEVHTEKRNECGANAKGVPPIKKRKQERKWKKGFDKFSHQRNFNPEPPTLSEQYPLLVDSTPIELFDIFYSNTIMELIVEETNRYASQHGVHDFNLSQPELKVFLGVILLSGYHILPREILYWSRDEDVGVPLVADKMARTRFQEIKRFLHLADNMNLQKEDKLAKIQHYLDECKKLLSQFGVFAKNISIDEQMVPYFGRHTLKQYIRGKPIKFGMKMWLLASFDGFPFSYDVYCGKEEQQHQEGLVGERVVKKFLKTTSDLKDHSLYTDNFFTSADLMDEMGNEGLRHTGTVRSNRIAHCPVTDSKVFKKTNRGDFELFGDGNLVLVQWNDSKPVLVMSNFESVNPTKLVKRWSKPDRAMKDVQMPGLIASYNANMGGVDLLDR